MKCFTSLPPLVLLPLPLIHVRTTLSPPTILFIARTSTPTTISSSSYYNYYHYHHYYYHYYYYYYYYYCPYLRSWHGLGINPQL